MSYYNTTNESGDVLYLSQRQASTQQDMILDIFKQNPGKLYTPFDIQNTVQSNWPITSIRRAMTNLTSDSELVRTDEQKQGEYGKANYCWRLNVRTDENGQIGMF